MPVYRRTALGNEAALNPKSSLPRKLRTLLIAVDGKTRRDIYVNSLQSFGDVDELLQSLKQSGLIEIYSQDAAKPAIPDTAAVPFKALPLQKASVSRTPAFTEPAESAHSTFSETVTRPLDSKDGREWDSFKPSSSKSSSQSAGVNARQDGTTAQHQLRNAISLMSDFVTVHLPEDSLEIVLSLESLNSVEQVVASLKGYEAMIARIGEPARQHVLELRAVLTKF